MTFSESYLLETCFILTNLNLQNLELMAGGLADVKGRLFILGVGGSAGHASHAVNDFRKICGIEAYCPTDNVSELTARINDDGWDTCLSRWLSVSRISSEDAVLVFSVGGGSEYVSSNLVLAMSLAKDAQAKIFAIVGRDGGFAKKIADVCIVIPPIYEERITPHTEGVCAILWHMLVSHPKLQVR